MADTEPILGKEEPKMKRSCLNLKLAVLSVVSSLAVAAPSFAAGGLTMPTVDLTDFYAAVGIMLGVAVAVMIVRKVRQQI
jgi:hypothetical protein